MEISLKAYKKPYLNFTYSLKLKRNGEERGGTEVFTTETQMEQVNLKGRGYFNV